MPQLTKALVRIKWLIISQKIEYFSSRRFSLIIFFRLEQLQFLQNN